VWRRSLDVRVDLGGVHVDGVPDGS
jgi:hypothetical protein